MPVQTIICDGHLTPDQEKTYFHVPFEMPEGVSRLEVAYRYSAQISSDPTVTGGNTIDLGVFDERGIDFLSAGFRGWSGSERDRFVITATEATPGYLAGALNPGTWNVLLGLYKIAPEGCDYHVEVRLTTGELVPPPVSTAVKPYPASRPPAATAPWLRGELHCHTYHSDGKLSPEAVIARARERGLDFLAVTDHNTTSGEREIETANRDFLSRRDSLSRRDPGLILIRGIESTSLKGHFNVWGIPNWIDFRITQPEQMQAALAFAIDHGGLTSCNHPKPFGPDWDFPQVENYHCVEVWNGPWTGLNEISLEFWLALLAKGQRRPAVGGSDYHRPGELSGGVERDLGTPTNWIYVPGEPSAESILKAVRQGHVSLSDAPDGPFLELHAGSGFASMEGDALAWDRAGELPVKVRCLRGENLHLRLLDQRGPLKENAVHETQAILLTHLRVEGSIYVRAELRDDDDRLKAMTNPVYLY